MVSVSEEEEEDEIVALPTDKYKPTSLEKMVTLVATLVEKSRGEDQRLQISQIDLSAITGGKVKHHLEFKFHIIVNNFL